MYFVYILWCRQTGRTYVRQPENLILRFRRHCEGSTRTTRERMPAPLVVYWDAHATRVEAMRREKYFKAGAGHRRKMEIVAEAAKEFAVG